MNATQDDRAEQTVPRHARDVMTAKVITVGPEQLTRDVAKILLENRISAVPVINADGVPIGMVSEGDIIGRPPDERVARIDWWLRLVTGAQPLDDDFQARLQAKDRTAGDVMSAPLVTVSEDTDVGEIARLLAIHHIKRVPVVCDGRIVGIVSRADLLNAIAAMQPDAPASKRSQQRSGLLSLFGEYKLPAWEVALAKPPAATPAAEPPKSGDSGIAAQHFRALVGDFHRGETQHHDETRRVAAQERSRRATELIDAHVFDPGWRQVLHNAQEAAERGKTEYMLLQFPSQLCIDGGRRIINVESDWPGTLRGEPAEIYLRWERELRPLGFSVSARVLEFPDGKPGDIGLFLVWGE